MESALPESPFGSFFFLVSVVRIIFNLLFLTLQLLFLKGAWPLVGWHSNFSWTLLVAVTVSAIQNLFFESLAIILSAFFVSWSDFQWLWRVLGSLTVLPMSTTIALTTLITGHRFIYTCFPLKAESIAPPIVTKTLFFFITFGHFGTMIFFCFDFGYYRYIPVFLSSSIKANTPIADFLFNLSYYSDWIIILNPLAYILILFVMFWNKSYKIAKKTELRMTLQALCSCLLEFICFVEWIVFPPTTEAPWGVHLFKSLTIAVYLGGSSIVYLVFNKRVRQNLFSKTRRSTSNVKSIPQTVI